MFELLASPAECAIRAAFSYPAPLDVDIVVVATEDGERMTALVSLVGDAKSLRVEFDAAAPAVAIRTGIRRAERLLRYHRLRVIERTDDLIVLAMTRA